MGRKRIRKDPDRLFQRDDLPLALLLFSNRIKWQWQSRQLGRCKKWCVLCVSFSGTCSLQHWGFITVQFMCFQHRPDRSLLGYCKLHRPFHSCSFLNDGIMQKIEHLFLESEYQTLCSQAFLAMWQQEECSNILSICPTQAYKSPGCLIKAGTTVES